MCGRSDASYPPGGAGFPFPKQKQFLVWVRKVTRTMEAGFGDDDDDGHGSGDGYW